MKKTEISVEGLKVLREQTNRSLKDGRVPAAERANVQTAIIEADARLVQAQAKDAE